MRTLILFLLSVLSLSAAPTSFLTVMDLPLTQTSPSQRKLNGWFRYPVSFFDGTEFATNFASAAATGTTTPLVLTLKEEMPAGTYNFWVAIMSQQVSRRAGVTSIGNTSIPATTFSTSTTHGDWEILAEFTSGVPFQNISMFVEKTAGVGTQQTYWFGGIGVTTNGWAQVEEDGTVNEPKKKRHWVNYFERVRETNDVSAGNMLWNSSFEFGLQGNGWTSGRTIDGTVIRQNQEIWSRLMTTNDAFHGELALVIKGFTSEKLSARFRAVSPAINIRGDEKERLYTLSWYAKCSSGSFLAETYFGLPEPGATGILTNAMTEYQYTATTSWTRHQTNVWLAPLPTRIAEIIFQNNASANYLQIDAVQLEEALNPNVASAYAPANTIEHSLDSQRNGGVFDVDESRTILARFWNEGAEDEVTYNWIAYDWLHRIVETGSTNWTIPVEYSEQTLTLGTTNMGLTRMYSWVEESPHYRPELSFSVIPLPDTPTLNSNSMFGVHGHMTRSFNETNFAFGLSLHRTLSPGFLFEMDIIQPTEGAAYSWTQSDRLVADGTNTTVFYSPLSSVADIPSWAKTNGFPRLDHWSNYVFAVVSRYKHVITFWDDINEPSQAGWNAGQFAGALTVTAAAIKAADPDAYFTAMGGVAEGGSSSFGQAVWDLLSTETKGQIDAISIHFYVDENDSLGAETTIGALATYTGKPVWNTETGVYGPGSYKGEVYGGIRGPSDIIASYQDHVVEFEVRKTVYDRPSDMLENIFESFFWGAKKYIYYDWRLAEYNLNDVNNNPTMWNYTEDSLNQTGVSYLWAKHFCDFTTTPGAAAITNAIGRDIMGVLFSKPNNTNTVAVWSISGTNYTMSVTNSGFSVYDMNGNILHGPGSFDVSLTIKPVYAVSTTLTSNQMWSTFRYSNVEVAEDTEPPVVSIEITMHGIPDERKAPFNFFWMAVDNGTENSYDTPENVLTRWRFPGVTAWSDYSSERFTTLDEVPDVLTQLQVQAKDVYGNESTVFSGPTFGTAAVVLPTPRAGGGSRIR